MTIARHLLAVLLILFVAGCAGVTPAPTATPAITAAGPSGEEGAPLRRQLWGIPSPVAGVTMQAVLYRPAGAGPFPLAVINHGSEEDPAGRAKTPLPDFPALTDYLVGRGYAVLLPQRPGHGATGGPYIETQGTCEFPDYAASGFKTASSIEAAVDYMRHQPFIWSDGVLIVGNSAGAWGALAYDSEAPNGIAGIVNFAGGRGGHNRNTAGQNCAPDRLVSAAAGFGKTARIPSLWLYSSNDTFFDAGLSRRMYDAFVAAGGVGEYHLLPPVAGDGHYLAFSSGANASWTPYLDAFLKRIGRR